MLRISNSDYTRSVEQEDRIRKMRHGKERKTLDDYRERISEILPMIKERMDRSKTPWYVMSMEEFVGVLGCDYEIYCAYTIYENVKIAMEDFNVVTGTKGYDGKGKWVGSGIAFRHKDEYDMYIWEREGFESRKEYEECRKEDERCRKIKKIARDCRKKDPESLFNNKKLIKSMFVECPIEDGGNENGS